MYNIRVKRFYDSAQIRHFKVPIPSMIDPKFDKHTGEILPRSDGKELVYNPFTEQYERVGIIDDDKEAKKARDNYNRAKNVIYDIARANRWDWFLTFTFSPEFVDRYDYSACCKKLSRWLDNTKRRHCDDMRYLVVPEQHKDGAWHFHGLFADCDGLDFVYSGKRDKKGRMIYNVGRYNWGFTTATRVGDSGKSASYLCKYVTKELTGVTKGKKRYWASKNCARSIVEDYLVEGNILDVLKEHDVDVKAIKRIDTPYNRVTYIEV